MSSVPTEKYRDHRLPLYHGATAKTGVKPYIKVYKEWQNVEFCKYGNVVLHYRQ